eukprot:9471492-Pyramimonas_sp.AAC.1
MRQTKARENVPQPRIGGVKLRSKESLHSRTQYASKQEVGVPIQSVQDSCGQVIRPLLQSASTSNSTTHTWLHTS